jgi:NAD-dependent dihydropyrimidine dehydrogenase PreA subunit
MPGLFIDVEVADEIKGDAEVAKKLTDACPVDIFSDKAGSIEIVEDNLDECILCELCTQAAPPGTVRVKKLYDGTTLERQ